MRSGNGKCEVCSLFSLNIYPVEFVQNSVMLSSFWVQFLWSIYFSFSSTVPLHHNSIRHLVVFEDMKCNRDSSLTLKVGYKLLRNDPNFLWRKIEQIWSDRLSVIRDFFNVIFAVWLPNFTCWLKMFREVSYS